jgi:hypothetical protein
MDILRNRLIKVKDFDCLSELCSLEENISLASTIINDVNVNITPRNFLCVFIIFNCYNDIIGKDNILENYNLITVCKNIIHSETYYNLKINLEKYIVLFKIWKDKDYKIIVDTLCDEYFQTSLSIINVSDNNNKILLSCYKNKILECAKTLDNNNDNNISNIVKSYSPLKITHNYLDKKYNKQFWESLSADFDSNNFETFIDTVVELKNFYMSFNHKNSLVISTIFNKDYFENILNNDYYNDDIKFFANESYDFIKLLHSKNNDHILEGFRFDINSNSTYLPDIIENIMELSKLLLNDIESIENTM